MSTMGGEGRGEGKDRGRDEGGRSKKKKRKKGEKGDKCKKCATLFPIMYKMKDLLKTLHPQCDQYRVSRRQVEGNMIGVVLLLCYGRCADGTPECTLQSVWRRTV